VTIASCDSKKRYFEELLKSVNTIRIQRFTNGDTLSIYVTNKEGVDIFKEIIDGKNEDLCPKKQTGRILYYSKGHLILDADQFNEIIEYSSNG
jgi:hypothetical protein